ncbi:MAG: NADH-quinone oxidoreductase subunit 8, partial [Planctomycetota bacterium]
VILVACAYSIMLERKLSAWMQDRVGPNRTGPKGMLQPLADGLKFLIKEDYTPAGVDRSIFTLAPALIIIPAMLGFAIIPWGGIVDLSSLPKALVDWLGLEGVTVKLVGADVNVGVIYLIAAASLGVYGVALGGWASNSKFSFLGGLRASAQMISYEIPMGIALLCVVLAAGTLDPMVIVERQQTGSWNVLQQPLAAIIFYTCMLAESNRAPFDLAEAESELVGGYHTEYSSMRFAMFFLAEYFHMITGAAFFSLLFLGGWSVNPIGALLPGLDLPAQGSLAMGLLHVAVMAGKTFLLVAFAMAIRWTLPRFRFDQLMRLSWEGLIPISLVLLLVASFFVYFGAVGYLWAGSLGVAAFVYLFKPILNPGVAANDRIRLIGSRFSPLRDGDATLDGRPAVALDDRAIPDPSQGMVSSH